MAIQRIDFDIDPMVDGPGPKGYDVIRSIVEIPKGSRNKYEVDKTTGLMKLDRHLYSSSHYPGDYGFIPRTLAEDGDALDILIMVNDATFSGCLIQARVIGVFKMLDHGANDYKILAVPDSDPLFSEYRELEDAPPISSAKLSISLRPTNNWRVQRLFLRAGPIDKRLSRRFDRVLTDIVVDRNFFVALDVG